MEFKNNSGLEFSDISSEEFREYLFGGGSVVRIDKPVMLNVSTSGGHRLFDESGLSHYIPSGWIHLKWKAKDGCANFVK